MGTFYDKFRSCLETDTGLDCGDPRATALVKMIYAVYGGPIYSEGSCPAGSEPVAPAKIIEAIETQAGIGMDNLMNAEERADFVRFATEEYEKAHAAWVKRVQKCGLDAGDDKGAGKSGMDGDSLGALALIVVGLLLILWSKKR